MQVQLVITGVTPILLHSDKAADPLSPEAKAIKQITSKRTKTDEDREEMARLEYFAAAYMDDQGPYIPAFNVERSLKQGGTVSRNGTRVEKAFFSNPECDHSPLIYDGPRRIEDLWADYSFRDSRLVKVGTSRVVRVRPKIDHWRLVLTGELDTAIIDYEEFQRVADDAGRMAALGDYRPRFGRYDAVVEKL